MSKIECFKIRCYSTDNFNITSPTKGEVIYEVPCALKLFTGNPVDIVADPFLFVYNDTLFLFYESKRMRGKGVIDMVSSKDLKTWSKPVTVLNESFHLSYPRVFEDDGHIYMMPETCADKSVRVYEADDDSLTHFTLKHKILERRNQIEAYIDYSDSSIIRVDGMYYLHTTVNYNKDNVLELFISDNLFGPYQAHPSSPIISSMKYGRNGGCLIEADGKIYRIAQDCMKRYGDNIHLFKIDEISPKTYQEQLVKEYLYDTSSDYYQEGGHHLNVVRFKEKYIISTDAKEYHTFILSRIIWKLRRLIGI